MQEMSVEVIEEREGEEDDSSSYEWVSEYSNQSEVDEQYAVIEQLNAMVEAAKKARDQQASPR